MKLSEFIVSLITEQVKEARKEIRIKKLEIAHLHKYIVSFRNMSDTQIEEVLTKDGKNKEIIDEYNKCKDALKEKSNQELKKLIRTGKIREVHYDKDGKEINLDEQE